MNKSFKNGDIEALTYLILHEADQRRDDNSGLLGDHGRQLITTIIKQHSSAFPNEENQESIRVYIV